MKKLCKEDEVFFDNLELFADVISDDSYHYAEILRDYHIKLKELLALTMKMSKSTEQCSYCGLFNM